MYTVFFLWYSYFMNNQPLFVVHHHTTCPGVIGRWANHFFGGYSTLYAPSAELPNAERLQQPIVVFGGNMSSNDPSEWMARELRWLERLVERKHPIFAICLGSQMLAKVLGEHVRPCPHGSLECGYLPLLREGEHIPSHVYQWHREGFEGNKFDSDVTVHARSNWNGGVAQAFSHHNAWGVQFHPEVTHNRIATLIAQLGHDINHPSARPLDTHFNDHTQHGPQVRAWLQNILLQQWGVAVV